MDTALACMWKEQLQISNKSTNSCPNTSLLLVMDSTICLDIMDQLDLS